MTETNFKKHASLRGVSEANDAATQLTELKRGQSASITTLTCKRVAFTMAEILLSLTIIGVVAAITLPSLMANINERTWNTQRKALYARLSQALSMMPHLNGYGTLAEDENGSVTADTAAETFLTDGLSKVLKINNICDSEHLADCGVAATNTNLTGNTYSTPKTLYELSSWFKNIAYSDVSYSTIDTKAAAFETANGESLVVYYNPSCGSVFVDAGSLELTTYGFPQANMCVNFVYDLNGSKGPNTFGKDIGFITGFNSVDSIIVAPMPSSSSDAGSSVWTGAASLCTAQDSESRIPNIDELSAMLINNSLVSLTSNKHYWSGSRYNIERAWTIHTKSGARGSDEKDVTAQIRCILR